MANGSSRERKIYPTRMPPEGYGITTPGGRMKFFGLKFGTPALVRWDCSKCGEKNSLHKKDVCIHCGNNRAPESQWRPEGLWDYGKSRPQ
jgi:ribosomal protein L37E